MLVAEHRPVHQTLHRGIELVSGKAVGGVSDQVLIKHDQDVVEAFRLNVVLEDPGPRAPGRPEADPATLRSDHADGC